MIKIDNKFQQLPRPLRWILYVIATVLVLAGVVALTVPSYLIRTLQDQTMLQTGRKLTIDHVAINLLTLSADVRGVSLYEANQSDVAFSADELLLKISPASLVHLAPVVREVKLVHPQLQLMRARQGDKEITNFSDVIAKLAEHPSKGGDPARFSISNIQLADGVINLDDHVAGKKVHINALEIDLPFISNFAAAVDVFVEPYLSATIDGSKVELKGRSKPFSSTLDTNLAIDIDQFDLREIVPFSPQPLPYKIKSAKLTTRLTLNFSAQKTDQHISLSGTANLDDVALEDRQGAPLYSAKQINLNVQEANLATQHIAVNVLEINEPQLWVGLNQQGILNWLPAQKAAPEKKEVSAAPTEVKPAQFELTHFLLKKGTVHWSDAANATPAAQIDIADISVDAEKISTDEKAEPAKVKLSFGTEQHQHLRFDGTVHPSSAAVAGQLTLADFSLADYQPYANRFIDANVTGKFGLQTHLELHGANVNLSALTANLEDLLVKANRSEFGSLSAKKIGLNNANVNTETRQAKVGQFILDQVHGDLFRTADGKVNLTYLMKKSSAAPGQSTPAAATKNAPGWQASVDQIALNDSSFAFGDKAVKPAVVMNADQVNIKLTNVSSNLANPVNMVASLTLNKTGKFAIDGSASGKSAQLNVAVQNFAFMPLQPYFTQFLNVSLEKGNLSTKGKVSWTAPGEVRFQGGLKLANFATSDKETSDDFLVWKSLNISGIDVDVGGKQSIITLGKIDLTEFYARAILSEKGRLNLEDIVAQPAAPTMSDASRQPTDVTPTQGVPAPYTLPQPVANSTAPAPLITIGAINLNKGAINYTDNFISPHYSMRMTGMSGTIGTIRSDQPQSAPININGKVDDEAPIAISGSLNPLFKPMLLDMKLTATGVDLPRLTMYALKYAGYPIVKGKLSLDVEYHIKDNQLEANNSLTIDQLTFGDKVEGPDATHLPVPFLVSLLTDSNGKINLDLPISGTLNDPQFSIGGLIVRVLVNVLEKVVLSPFSLLAHAFGGGEDEMAYIEFDPGSYVLTDAAKAKLDNLAKALADRQQVKMDMIGRADLATDDAGLREHMLNSQIKKIYRADADDDTPMSDADRARAVDKIYSAAKFDKPRNLIGLSKSLPTADMEKLIIANTKVTEDDIRALAVRRESVVHSYLTDVDHVAPERLFSIAPKLSGDGIKDKGAISRVDFELKM